MLRLPRESSASSKFRRFSSAFALRTSHRDWITWKPMQLQQRPTPTDRHRLLPCTIPREIASTRARCECATFWNPSATSWWRYSVAEPAPPRKSRRFLSFRNRFTIANISAKSSFRRTNIPPTTSSAKSWVPAGNRIANWRATPIQRSLFEAAVLPATEKGR